MNTYHKIPNLNILPEEYRLPPLSILQAGLILIIIAAAFLSYTVYQQKSNNLTAIADLENELNRWTLTEEMSQKTAQADLLRNDISTLQEELSKHQEARQEVKARQIDWPNFHFSLLSTSDPVIETITQSELGIYVTGTASGIGKFGQYHDKLLGLSSVTSIDIPTLNKTDQGLYFEMVIAVKGE